MQEATQLRTNLQGEGVEITVKNTSPPWTLELSKD
jgi:hypothetical protein